MSRKFEEKKLVLATHNPGKLVEMKALLAPYGVEVLSAGDLNLSEVEETGLTFRENAALKALSCVQESGLACLADDSGICVPTLGNAPGIYSARWAGKDRNFQEAVDRIFVSAHDDEPDAYFSCTLVLAWPDKFIQTFEGRLDGFLKQVAKGEQGFGYDPYFYPKNTLKSLGEHSPEEKQKISHRAKALKKLIDTCF